MDVNSSVHVGFGLYLLTFIDDLRYMCHAPGD